MRGLPAALAVILMASPAFAICGGNAEEVFTCTVSGGKKQVTICSGDGIARYLFGKAGRDPELELSAQVAELHYMPWNGIGRSIYEEVAFDNGAHTYTVYAALDRTILEGDPQDPISGGVVVTKGDQTLAELTCDAGSVRHSLDGFYAQKQNLGQCWDHHAFAWTANCPAN